jgi:Uma2 family endonuclease
MTGALRRPTRMTFDEYLAFEETTEKRHELIDGGVYAMSGATDIHNLICTNLTLLIAGPILGKCQVFQGSMKLKVDHARDSDGYYPDLMVSCASTDRDRLFRKEPVLLIEALSPSTARVDRGEKKLNYLQIPSLEEYVLVAQDIPKVDVMRRRNAWAVDEYYPGDTFTLDSVGLTLAMDDIYRTISFGPTYNLGQTS